ncbi:MAG: hypothetical protein Q9186_004202 [Xanthomendoza sp. 1 TL-2023]
MPPTPEFALAIAQANGFQGALSNLQDEDQITVVAVFVARWVDTIRNQVDIARLQPLIDFTNKVKGKTGGNVGPTASQAQSSQQRGHDVQQPAQATQYPRQRASVASTKRRRQPRSSEHEDERDEYDDEAEDLDEEDDQAEEDAEDDAEEDAEEDAGEDAGEDAEEDSEEAGAAPLRRRRAHPNPTLGGTDKAHRAMAKQEKARREEARVRANAEREARRSTAQERADTRREQNHQDAERRAQKAEENRLRVLEEQEEGRQRGQDESRPTTAGASRADGAPSTAQTLHQLGQSASTNNQNIDPRLLSQSALTNNQNIDPRLLTQSVQAIILPESFPPPLRLTDTFIDKASLQRTLDELSATPGFAVFDPKKKGVLIEFLKTLLSPTSYWRLRQTIYKMAVKTGFDTERMEDVQSHGAIPSTTPSTNRPKPPEFLANCLQVWRHSLDFTQQTATSGTIVALKMHNDMQSYLYWCQLMTIWRSDRAGYQDLYSSTQHNRPTGHGLHTDLLYNNDAYIPPEDAKAVMDFLESEIARRNNEIGIVTATEKHNRTRGLLRVLVAPYLGYTIVMEAGKGQGTRRAKIQNDDSTTRMFNKMWNNVNVRGKTVAILCKGLGRGALLLVTRGHLTVLGSPVFQLIVPVLVRNHGNVLIPIFRMIYNRFFLPVQKQKRIHYADVGALLHISGPESLSRLCAAHPQGLKGILELEGKNIDEALLALDNQANDGNLGDSDATPMLDETALKDEMVDDIFSANELIQDQQAAFQERDEWLRQAGTSSKRTSEGAVVDGAGRSEKRRG